VKFVRQGSQARKSQGSIGGEGKRAKNMRRERSADKTLTQGTDIISKISQDQETP